jgi:hypothetical protein
VTTHFLTFVGATSSLATELNVLRRRIEDLVIVAPAARKNNRDLTEVSIKQALHHLCEEIRNRASFEERARLSVWAFAPTDAAAFGHLWEYFGQSSWIELIPSDMIGKNVPTRVYIERRIRGVVESLHEVSSEVYRSRKSSPFPIPLKNFKSKTSRELNRHWYHGLTFADLKKEIRRASNIFRQLHTNNAQQHGDDRALLFSPARDTECHGKPHPLGNTHKCFISGRFRFGAAIYPGFHYDVTQAKGLLECVVYDCDGQSRDLRPERRRYINIFPNDHLLPERS